MKPTTTLASTITPDGATIELQEHDGQFYLRINGTALMSTTAHASEEEMGTIACERIPDAARILIGGLGFGFSLRRVLDLVSKDSRVDLAELLPEIVEWNRLYLREVNGRCLDDERVTVCNADVFELIQNPAGGRYDAILLDVDNSPDPLVQSRNARLYSGAGLAAIKSALAPGGRAVFWSGSRDRAFEKDLRRVFEKTQSIAARAYPSARRPTHTLFVADCP